MAILAMSRRAILALPWLGKPTGKPSGPPSGMSVVLMGKMPMLRFGAAANIAAGPAPAEDLARQWSWGLTPTGNWETSAIDGNSQTRTHDNANQILTISGVTYAPLHDEAGNNVRGPRPADPNANNAAHFRYDAWSRLASVHLDNGDMAGTLDPNDSPLATYRYDGLNRRVRKVSAVDGNSVAEYVFFNENWQVVEIRRGVDGNEPASTAYKQYAWDLRYIDAPVCRWWDGDRDGTMEPASGEMHYFTNDGNFNTTALIDANSGSVVERYTYDPYGKVTVLNGAAGAEKDPNVSEWTPDADNKSDWDNDVLFCGYQYDPVTGLYHVRERYYDPVTGTWKTRDRILYPDGMNLYEYVRSRPTGWIDSFGFQTSTSQPTSQLAPLDWSPLPPPTNIYPYFEGDKHREYAEQPDYHKRLMQLDEQLNDPMPFELGKEGGVWATFPVSYPGREKAGYIGSLRFLYKPHSEKRGGAEDSVSGGMRKREEYCGVQVKGGMTSFVDTARPPYCCKELRWSQVIDKTYDGFDNKDAGKTVSPFYWREEENPRDRRKADILSPPGSVNPLDPPLWGYRGQVRRNGYNFYFEDTPMTPESLWPTKVDAKLCLVCVKTKKGNSGTVKPLICVTYGYSIKSGEKTEVQDMKVADTSLLTPLPNGWKLAE